jgi:hypothetical protein
MTFEGLQVGAKTEQEYLASKEPKTQESWKADLQAMSQLYTQALSQNAKGLKVAAGPAAAPGPYAVRANVNFIEPGIFTAIYNAPSVVKATIRIADAQGVVLDEINITTKVAPGSIMGVPTNVSTGERLRKCAELLGRISAQYLAQRTSGK